MIQHDGPHQTFVLNFNLRRCFKGEVDIERETEGLTAVDNDEIKRARLAEKAAEKLKEGAYTRPLLSSF
jgi:hypothetical protein